MAGEEEQYADQTLGQVLSFLQAHFPDAAEAVLKQLNQDLQGPQEEEEGGELADEEDGEPGADGASSSSGRGEHDGEHRAKSAEAVVTRDDEDLLKQAEEAPLRRWQSAEATLTRRLSGSTRLYEDPDVDEYEGYDDVGYWRREVSRQDEFAAQHLERGQDDESSVDILRGLGLQGTGASSSGGATPASASTPGAGSPPGDGSRSPSSSASLSSPGALPCVRGPGDADAAGDDGGGGASTGAPAADSGGGGEEAAWDEGPAGITFAEPVTTPTKDPSRRSSASEAKPGLSRVESLSNSFIDELDSDFEGGAANWGEEDAGAPGAAGGGGRGGSFSGGAKRGGAEGLGDGGGGGGSSGGGVVMLEAVITDAEIEFALPPPPAKSFAPRGSSNSGEADASREQAGAAGGDGGGGPGAGAPAPARGDAPAGGGGSGSSGDLPGIFDIALRMAAGSRASSLDVLHGSVLGGTSDVGSERGFVLGLGGGGGAAGQGAGDHHSSPPGGPAAPRPSPLGLGGGRGSGGSGLGDSGEGSSWMGPLQSESSASAFGSAAAQAGGGFSFPVTPPTHEEEEVHEARAERVFSTWASSHSRTAEEAPDLGPGPGPGHGPGGAGGASDDEDGSHHGKHGGGGAVLPFCTAALDTGAPLRQGSSASAHQLDTWWEGPASASAAAAAAAAEATRSKSLVSHQLSPSQSRRATGSSCDSSMAVVAPPLPLPLQRQQQQQQQQAVEGRADGRPPQLPPPPSHQQQQQQQQQQEHPVQGPGSAGGSPGQPQRVQGSSSAGRSSSQQLQAQGPGSASGSPGLQQGARQRQQQQQQQQQQQASPSAGGAARRPPVSLARPLFVSEEEDTFCTPAASGAGSSTQHSCQAASDAGRAGASGSPAGGGADDGSVSGGGRAGGGSGGVGAARGEDEEGSLGDPQGAVLSPAARSASDRATDITDTPGARYVVDESGNLLYEYDPAYIDAKYEVFDLRVVHRRRRTGFEDSKEFPIRRNDLIAGRYQVMDFLGSAAFSQAVQALDVATGGLVCLKIIKNNKDYFDQSLDEIKLLRYVNGHDPNDEHHIVRLYDFFYYKVTGA
ncbi:Dual specificity protein kinase pom1 [Monoraphidium neglectum]|uniref:Dual specificity protein kinase pom1 n=1 Tax=Monoraphidium neglectum TaxID=145388 RepID=A0A0D2JGM7_9CHLO|nr:Dual specificity protein kinase pom1 [Monoraphidium neglectum]KIY98552.1 Dual specificity protein kinase pom1 [Monoraphidium neglectum]|eukprot:XP_013897572.1 Dual specificity protein kinase pom1 [Monoraphidium neglectum]